MLRKERTVIGRKAECEVTIAEKRLSGEHCTLTRESTKYFVTDTSTNGTYVGGQKIGRNNKFQVTDQTDIWLLPPARVPKAETIGFKFVVLSGLSGKLLAPL